MSDEQIIYLSPEEELTTVRERLANTQAKRITLVIPSTTQLRSHVGWRLLHSRARELDKDVLVISSDRQIRAVVKAAGFKVADSLESTPTSSSRPTSKPSKQVNGTSRPGSRPRTSSTSPEGRSIGPVRTSGPGKAEGGIRNSTRSRGSGRLTSRNEAARRRMTPEGPSDVTGKSAPLPSEELSAPKKGIGPRANKHVRESVSSTFDIRSSDPHFQAPFIRPAQPNPEDEEPDLLSNDVQMAQRIRRAATNPPGEQGSDLTQSQTSKQRSSGKSKSLPLPKPEDEDPFLEMAENQEPGLFPEQKSAISLDNPDLQSGYHQVPNYRTDEMFDGEIENLGESELPLSMGDDEDLQGKNWEDQIEEDQPFEAPRARGAGRRSRPSQTNLRNREPMRDRQAPLEEDLEDLPTWQPSASERIDMPAPAPRGRTGSSQIQRPSPSQNLRRTNSQSLRPSPSQNLRPTPSQNLRPPVSQGLKPSQEPRQISQRPPRSSSPNLRSSEMAQTLSGERAWREPPASTPTPKLPPLSSQEINPSSMQRPSQTQLKRPASGGGQRPATLTAPPIVKTRPENPSAQASAKGNSQTSRRPTAPEARKQPTPSTRSRSGINRSRLGMILTVAVLAVLLLILLAAAYFGPSADVTLIIPTKGFTQNVSLVAGSPAKASASNQTVTSQTLSYNTTITGQGKATGKTQVGTVQATGQIKITNNGSQQVVIPSGTIVETSGGVRFATTAETLIATKSSNVGNSSPIPVEAQSAGVNGNVDVGTITVIPTDSLQKIAQNNGLTVNSLNLAVANPNATTGGGTGNATTVNQDDITNLKTDLHKKQVVPAVDSWVKQQLRKGDIAGTPTITEQVTSTPAEKGIASDGNFSERVEVRAQVLVVRLEDLQKAAANQMTDGVNKKNPGYELIQLQEITFQKMKTTTSDDNKAVSIDGSATAQIAQQMSETGIRSMIKGKSLDEAKKYLTSDNSKEVPKINDATIVVNPGFFPRVPLLESNIHVIFRPAPVGA